LLLYRESVFFQAEARAFKGDGLGVLGEIERGERVVGGRFFCLVSLFFLKRFFCVNVKKAPDFSKAPILRLYCRRPKTFAASSRRGSAFALDSSDDRFPRWDGGESARFPVSTRRRVGASGTFSPSLV
jgi:hypothetical protein